MFLLYGPISKAEKESYEKRMEQIKNRRDALKLPTDIPKFIIKGIPTRTCHITGDFWNGFHLSESMVIMSLQLKDGNGDSISLNDYMKYSRMSIRRMIHIVAETLPALTFFNSRKNISAVHLRLTDITAKNLKEFLRQNRETLRGMGEKSVIVCENGKSFILVDDVVGYVSSSSTSEVTYPNATYRDGDICDMLVSAGEPVVVHGETQAISGYPIEFSPRKQFPKEAERLLWAVQFETIEGEV